MLLESVLPLLGSFNDRVAVVTGASSGIGWKTALTLAQQGASLALVARRRDRLEQLASKVSAVGARALVLPIDVSDARAVHGGVAKVRRVWGRIDMLINNAGILIPAAVENLKRGDLEAMFRVNVLGSLSMMQAVLPFMRAQGDGTIINVASLAGRRGITPLGGYCATKFALVGLTEALRTEMHGSNVHVGLVLPGVVDTPMAHGFNQDDLFATWPSILNMPPEWVVTAILLAARFRLREVSVPPGVATMELLGALTPGLSDVLIRWTSAASRMLADRLAAPKLQGQKRAKKIN